MRVTVAVSYDHGWGEFVSRGRADFPDGTMAFWLVPRDSEAQPDETIYLLRHEDRQGMAGLVEGKNWEEFFPWVSNEGEVEVEIDLPGPN